MNDNEVKTVQMTAEEAAQYAAFKAEQERKAAADKARKDRKVYGRWWTRRSNRPSRCSGS